MLRIEIKVCKRK